MACVGLLALMSASFLLYSGALEIRDELMGAWLYAQRDRVGFTLVEIMVVVAIIGLLAAIAIPAFQKARQAARLNIARNDLRVLSGAVTQLAMDTGRWPGGIEIRVQGDAETWDLRSAGAGLLSTDGSFPNWNGPYCRPVPIDPWGSPYFFDPDYSINGKSLPVVGSFGPNRQGKNMYDSDDIYSIQR